MTDARLPGEHSLLLIPETVEELESLERSRLRLGAMGCPVELWEILLLTQSGAWDPRRLAAPSSEGPAPTPALALRRLRELEGPFIRDVRLLLERMEAPADIARAELVIASVSASRRNRAALLRWIADPARYRPEAERRIASLSWRAGRLKEQLERRRAKAWESSVRDERPVPVAAAPAAPVLAGPVPPLHPKMVADLRRAHRASRLLGERFHHRIEPWELLLMISSEGERIRAKLDSLLAAERSDQWESLEETALGLVGRGVGVRHEWGFRVKELRGYLESLCGVRNAVLDVGLEVLLAASAGRRRASAWLESPIDRSREAATYMSAVFAIAARYAPELAPETVVLLASRAA